jgi:hypothetical protein
MAVHSLVQESDPQIRNTAASPPPQLVGMPQQVPDRSVPLQEDPLFTANAQILPAVQGVPANPPQVFATKQAPVLAVLIPKLAAVLVFQ